jgi:hypothetical protein
MHATTEPKDCFPPAQPAARAAIQCLKLFFLNAFESNDLVVKRVKVSMLPVALKLLYHVPLLLIPGSTPHTLGRMPPQVSADGPGKGAAEQQADAEDVYKQWLLRHYNSYQLQLLQVMVESKFATVQVSTQQATRPPCRPAEASQAQQASQACITRFMLSVAPRALEHMAHAWRCAQQNSPAACARASACCVSRGCRAGSSMRCQPV